MLKSESPSHGRTRDPIQRLCLPSLLWKQRNLTPHQRLSLPSLTQATLWCGVLPSLTHGLNTAHKHCQPAAPPQQQVKLRRGGTRGGGMGEPRRPAASPDQICRIPPAVRNNHVARGISVPSKYVALDNAYTPAFRHGTA